MPIERLSLQFKFYLFVSSWVNFLDTENFFTIVYRIIQIFTLILTDGVEAAAVWRPRVAESVR